MSETKAPAETKSAGDDNMHLALMVVKDLRALAPKSSNYAFTSSPVRAGPSVTMVKPDAWGAAAVLCDAWDRNVHPGSLYAYFRGKMAVSNSVSARVLSGVDIADLRCLPCRHFA